MTASSDVAPTVSFLVAAAVIGSAPERLQRALAAIGSEPTTAVFVIGGGAAMQRTASEGGARWVRSIHDLLEDLEPAITHIWLLHDDARPRRGALRALYEESERVEASVAGSKLLDAAAPDKLESVGGATDAFGVPYTGLQPGELDQEQYDVVRDVAFIPGASVLVRRDLLRGLQGPDPLLPMVASGIDLAQRARLAGGRVVVVPSSEVLHEGACAASAAPGWREQAGQYRAIFKAYSWLTLLWVLPFRLAIDLLDALAHLLMGSPRGLVDLTKALLWNLKNIGSAFSGRSKAQAVRSAGDEELFRYQMAGSVRLRAVGEDLTDWFRERSSPQGAVGSWMDQRRGFWQEPGFLAAFGVLLATVVAARTLISGRMPLTGYALALPENAWQTLRDVAGGWNPASFGSAGPMHSAVGATAAVQLLLFDRPELTATILTVGSMLAAYFGTARLVGRLGVGPAGRIGGGLSAALGPVVVGIGATGYWPALLAAGVAPWAIDAALQPWPERLRKRLGRIGVGLLATGFMAALVPLAVGVPLVAVFLWALLGPGGTWSAAWNTVVRALAFAVGSLVFLGQTLYWSSLRTIVAGGQAFVWEVPIWMAALGALTTLAVLLVGAERTVVVGGIGGLMAAAGVWLTRSAEIGTGSEPVAAGFVLASVGLAWVVAAAFDLPASLGEERHPRRLAGFVVALVGAALVASSFGVLAIDGRAGFGEDRFGAPLSFTEARSDEHGPDRVLFIGTDLPGEARVMGGTEFRVTSAPRPLFTEAWLSRPVAGDRALEAALRELIVSDELRPGATLAEFGIKWVVSTSPNRFEQAFVSRLDMKRLPLYEDQPYTVYENLEPSPRAITDGGQVWTRTGLGYEGPASGGQVRLAESFDPRWMPDPAQDGWAVRLSSADGAVGIEPNATLVWFARLAGLAALLAALAAVASIGGRR